MYLLAQGLDLKIMVYKYDNTFLPQITFTDYQLIWSFILIIIYTGRVYIVTNIWRVLKMKVIQEWFLKFLHQRFFWFKV